jgi:hypothetical protein
MEPHELAEILQLHAEWLANPTRGRRANLVRTNLEEANLERANLVRANLEEANLERANLEWANLAEANLVRANLEEANLERANLKRANLEEANLVRTNLKRANLERANLVRANIDFSVWPLWCGSQNVKVDARIAAQLAAHFCMLDCDDPAYQAARAACLEFAKTSHKAKELGLVE